MHLHDDLGALGQPGAVAGGGDRLLASGCPGAEPLRVVELLAGTTAEAHVAEAGPAETGLRGVRLLGVGPRVRRQLEHDHVVHDLRVAREDVGAGEEGVLLELRVEDEAAVVVGADAVGRGRRVGLRHRQRHPPLPRAQRPGLGGRGRGGGRVVTLVAVAGVRGLARRGPRRGGRLVVGLRRPAAGQQQGGGRGQRDQAAPGVHPGGQLIGRPPSRCRWVWKTLWPGLGAGVEDQPVGVAEAVLRGDLGRHPDQLRQRAGVGSRERGGVLVVGTGDDEHVGRGLRVEVAEGQRAVGLVHDVGGDVPRDDRAEDAVGPGHPHTLVGPAQQSRNVGRVNPRPPLRVELACRPMRSSRRCGPSAAAW